MKKITLGKECLGGGGGGGGGPGKTKKSLKRNGIKIISAVVGVKKSKGGLKKLVRTESCA